MDLEESQRRFKPYFYATSFLKSRFQVVLAALFTPLSRQDKPKLGIFLLAFITEFLLLQHGSS